MAALPVALTVAGSDSGGGAGIEADIKTFTVHGVWATAALCAVTAQNTQGVHGVEVVSPEVIEAQVAAVVDDMAPAAAKTGMLADMATVAAVARALGAHPVPRLVCDPVFVSKHGHPLLAPEAVASLKADIFPLVTVLTPNLPEAEGLLGAGAGAIGDVHEMEDAARDLAALGPAAVLVKGGHLEGPEACDVFYFAGAVTHLRAPRIPGRHTHGTGCTLSAAICARLARGEPLPEAVAGAKRFVTEAIRAGVDVGRGIGPVNPAWALTPCD